LEDAAAQFRWRTPDTVDRTDDDFHQFIHILGAAIGEFPLCQRPNSFVRIKFWSVGGEMLDLETPVLSEKFLEWLSLMGGGVVHENDDRAAQVPQQLTQKDTDFFLCDVVIEE